MNAPSGTLIGPRATVASALMADSSVSPTAEDPTDDRADPPGDEGIEDQQGQRKRQQPSRLKGLGRGRRARAVVYGVDPRSDNGHAHSLPIGARDSHLPERD